MRRALIFFWIAASGWAWGQAQLRGSIKLVGHSTITATSLPTGDFFLAPAQSGGDDRNPCTQALPCLTPQHVSALVRGLPQGKHVVTLRGGDYFLTAPWVLGAADSGTTSLPIIYQNFPGEVPVINGGLKLTGTWVVDNTVTCGGTCTAYSIDLDANPSDPSHLENFEALFFRAERRYRPTTTTGAYLTQQAPFCSATQSANCSAKNTPACPGSFQCFDRLHRQSGDTNARFHGVSSAGVGIHDVEFDVFAHWTMDKMRLATANSAGCTSQSDTACFTGTTVAGSEFGPMQNHRYLIENCQPGDTGCISTSAKALTGLWYLDRCTAGCANGPDPTWTLHYYAAAGENPNLDPVYIPQISQLLQASGVKNIVFQGIQFSYDNYVVPDAGQPAVSFASNIPAAISCMNCSNVVFDGDAFAHLGNWAVEFVGSSTPGIGNQVVNSALYDLGTGAIRIGQTPCRGAGATCPNGADSDANVSQFNTISGNVMFGGQRMLAGGIGLAPWIGNSHHNTVQHNSIFDWYSGGIGVGATLNNPPSAPSFSHDNNIAFNDIHDIGQGVTSDMGCFHAATANTNGNVFSNNTCHDVTQDPTGPGYGGQGIYLDQGSSNWRITNNLVYRTTESTIYLNNPSGMQNNIISNNILAFGARALFKKGGDENLHAFTASQNIFYFDKGNSHGGIQFEGLRSLWSCGQTACASISNFNQNLYFNTARNLATNPDAFFTTDGNSTQFNPSCKGQGLGCSFAQWQALGEDMLSVVQDPLFNGPSFAKGDDYTFQAGSPIAKITFTPFDSSQNGAKSTIAQFPLSVPAAFPMRLLDKATGF